jgi:ketosteroid isomerase-like protein
VSDARREVLDAAAALVEAFGSHDKKTYFEAFHAGATFVFHTAEQPLGSRAEYERLWSSWEQEDGFHVESCASTDQHVQLLGSGDVAVFTHRVHTVVRTAAGEEELDERETVVFERDADGRWLAVHEHLSPAP